MMVVDAKLKALFERKLSRPVKRTKQLKTGFCIRIPNAPFLNHIFACVGLIIHPWDAF